MRPAESPASPAVARLDSVDLLRGIVMVLMALDHARDFFHAGAFRDEDPMAPATTTAALFFTRWVTHFCAPVFVFLAGTGAFLSTTRGKSKTELSWFLVTRGLWLIVLELTWVRWAGWKFGINLHEHQGLVIWAIGWSMIVLAALVHLPLPATAAFGLVMMAGHNTLDGVKPDVFGSWGWLWQVLHAGDSFNITAEVKFGAGYPLVPWIGVMAAGYSFGAVLLQPPLVRRQWLISLGILLTVLFVLLRVLMPAGDPKPWSAQGTILRTLFSFLDCQKYPPSIWYLLMTLGPALLCLAWLDRGTPGWLRPALVFGRVPLFFYLLHLPLLHALSVATHLLIKGRAEWLYGGNSAPPPPSAGFALPWVYLGWIGVTLLLYPACRWFAELKRRSKAKWLSYL
jgi:uncharacterized membrane protein